ncbi:asparagine synthetase B family protein [Streptomyces marianii]|uniref:Asparagine synthase n=1 Tax=Streptomyces marianii TaxID=1817406 RepID=A0A5R9E4G1_9ACTN|nr:hypothetical protein [Streptomyces marianii]TLQ43154.1 hypothetical protein FEF34_08370 [Streptomyces marianii]
MLGVVEMSAGVLRRTDPSTPHDESGVSAEATAHSFILRRTAPQGRPVYFRVGRGRLEWGEALESFLEPGGRVELESGALLALVHGQAAPPDSSPLAGVRRLTYGTQVQVDADGVTVSNTPPELPARPRDLRVALRDALSRTGPDYLIAYSGGLASASLAVTAAEAGHRAQPLHADFGLPGRSAPPAALPGTPPRSVHVDPYELADHHIISGSELLPPMPDFVIPRRLHAILVGDSGLPLVSGALLASLVSVKLPDVPRGPRSWRLLTCEPFHISGTMGSLSEAAELLDNRVVYAPGRRPAGDSATDSQQLGAPPPPSPTGGSKLGWLTEDGKQAYETAHRGSMAVWQDRLDAQERVVGRLMGGLEEQGTECSELPAADPRVLAAAAALPPHVLGRIRRGGFQNHLPLHRIVSAAGVTSVSCSTPGHWLRLCAASYLYRERTKLAAELTRECALGDLGLVEPGAVAADFNDGRALSAKALPLLRLVWLDRWLRERS